MFPCVSSYWNLEFDVPDYEFLRANCMYVMSIKTSDAPWEITDSFDDFATRSFEFSYLWFFRRRKVLETGTNVPLFNLLFEMKFILTRLTRRVFASGLYLSHFYKDA